MQSALIAPEKASHPVASESPAVSCSQAIVALCPLSGLKRKLSVSPLSEPFISCLDLSCQYAGIAGLNPVLVLECTDSSIAPAQVLEELAARGIKSVIVYGYAESLTTLIPEGQIVLAESAVDVDPATCRPVRPHSRLFQNLRDCAARQCVSLRRARILSANAAAPDYRQKIARRRELDTEVVHRSVWEFLSTGQQLAVATVFACVIGDQQATIGGDHSSVDESLSELEAIVTETLSERAAEGPNYG